MKLGWSGWDLNQNLFLFLIVGEEITSTQNIFIDFVDFSLKKTYFGFFYFCYLTEIVEYTLSITCKSDYFTFLLPK